MAIWAPRLEAGAPHTSLGQRPRPRRPDVLRFAQHGSGESARCDASCSGLAHNAKQINLTIIHNYCYTIATQRPTSIAERKRSNRPLCGPYNYVLNLSVYCFLILSNTSCNVPLNGPGVSILMDTSAEANFSDSATVCSLRQTR